MIISGIVDHGSPQDVPNSNIIEYGIDLNTETKNMIKKVDLIFISKHKQWDKYQF